MREMMFGQDADFNDEAFIGRYNPHLANDLGNLVTRATTMIHRYCGGVVPAAHGTLLAREPEVDLRRRIDALVSSVKAHAKTFQLGLRVTRDMGCDRRHESVYRDSRGRGRS